MNKSIAVRCFLSADTGYGQMNCAILSALQKRDILTYIIPTSVDERQAPVPEELKKCFCSDHPFDSELLIQSPPYVQMDNKRTVRLTLHESTRLRPELVYNLNKAEAVITCSDWGVSCLSASGVIAPLYKVPLFVDRSKFHHMHGAYWYKYGFAFGCGGRVGPQGSPHLARKGLVDIMAGFKTAFPSDDTVRLEVKVTDTCYVPDPSDSRIHINTEFLDDMSMNEWYNMLDVYVTLSKGEGWGLMPHQALECGVPLLGLDYSGVAEFFQGVPVNYSYEQATGGYQGLWAQPDMKDFVDKLRTIRNNASLLNRTRLNIRDQGLTVDNTMNHLVPILEKHRVII